MPDPDLEIRRGGEFPVIQTLRKGGGRQAVSSKDRGGSPSLRNKRFQSSHTAWKLERKQKNGWRGRGRGRGEEVPSFPSLSPVIHVFFALVPAFETNLARKHLLRRLRLARIRHCINASRIIIAWLVTYLYRAKHKQFAKHQYHGCQPWLHRH